MKLVRLQHIGVVVTNLQRASEQLERLFGLKVRDFRDDQGKGMQYDSRILLGNDCWLHLVQNWNPESRVYQFHERFGEGLEHIALQTSDIEADVQHVREIGIPLYQDRIFNAADGLESFVYPDQLPGFTVELIQPHDNSWSYPTDAGRVSDKMGIFRVQHIGVVVKDLQTACERLDKVFGLKERDFRDDQGRGMQYDARILLGNDCWLHLVQNWNPESRVYQWMEKYGEGLEHIALETTTIELDIDYLRGIGVPVFQDKIFDAADGYEAFVYPDQTPGFTVELIQPHDHSWGYPSED